MKIISIIVAVAMLFTLAIMPQIAKARASDLVQSYNITIYALEDGRIQAKATASSNKNTSKLGFPTILIQEYNGSSWVTKKTVSGNPLMKERA